MDSDNTPALKRARSLLLPCAAAGARIALAAFLAVCGLAYAVQDRMIFYHVHDDRSRAYLHGRPGYAEVGFTAENGKTYHGMMYAASDAAAPLVLYFGGNGEVSYSNLRMREALHEWPHFDGFHYLFVDYDGYGINGGRAHYRNMYEMALAAFDYAAGLPHVDADRIVAMGFSLGTGCAVHLAANRPVAGLILAAPYANGYDLYNNVLPIFFGPMRLLVRQKLPSDEYAPAVAAPALVIASRRDEAIPFVSSERLSRLLGGDAAFVALNDALHNEIFEAEGVWAEVRAFLRAFLG